ncbi:hypothetical protein CNY89_23840, partial [Amaricoccus sp. HAR-UPW-R2A-40]
TRCSRAEFDAQVTRRTFMAATATATEAELNGAALTTDHVAAGPDAKQRTGLGSGRDPEIRESFMEGDLSSRSDVNKDGNLEWSRGAGDHSPGRLQVADAAPTTRCSRAEFDAQVTRRTFMAATATATEAELNGAA